jgi:hypothetical protein
VYLKQIDFAYIPIHPSKVSDKSYLKTRYGPSSLEYSK